MFALLNLEQLITYNGVPNAGGKLYVFLQDRTTLAHIYGDVNGETTIANPVILDSLGMGEVYVNNAYMYHVVMEDPYGNELFSRDVYPTEGSSGGAGGMYNGADPIVVNNDTMIISANNIPFGVQEPLYFVQDDDEACIIGFSADEGNRDNFIAEYGSSTIDEITSAFNAGKDLICRYNDGHGRVFSAPLANDGYGTYTFSTVYNNSVYYFTLSPNATSGAWTLSSKPVGGEQVQSDWDEVNTASPAYIKNKPDLDNYVETSAFNSAISALDERKLDTSAFSSVSGDFVPVSAITYYSDEMSPDVQYVNEISGNEIKAKLDGNGNVIDTTYVMKNQMSGYLPISATDVAIGDSNSSYNNSLAQGYYNSADTNSFAQGTRNSAYQDGFAQGIDTSAKQYAMAQGKNSYAYNYSMAVGSANSASNFSQAFGLNTIASASGMAIGTYNKTNSAAFVIGNGLNENTRSDAFIINHDGSVSARGNISANGVELENTIVAFEEDNTLDTDYNGIKIVESTSTNNEHLALHKKSTNAWLNHGLLVPTSPGSNKFLTTDGNASMKWELRSALAYASAFELSGGYITGYDGTAFKAGDEFPQSATEAVETVTANSADWNSTTDTVSANSASWGNVTGGGDVYASGFEYTTGGTISAYSGSAFDAIGNVFNLNNGYGISFTTAADSLTIVNTLTLSTGSI